MAITENVPWGKEIQCPTTRKSNEHVVCWVGHSKFLSAHLQVWFHGSLDWKVSFALFLWLWCSCVVVSYLYTWLLEQLTTLCPWSSSLLIKWIFCAASRPWGHPQPLPLGSKSQAMGAGQTARWEDGWQRGGKRWGAGPYTPGTSIFHPMEKTSHPSFIFSQGHQPALCFRLYWMAVLLCFCNVCLTYWERRWRLALTSCCCTVNFAIRVRCKGILNPSDGSHQTSVRSSLIRWVFTVSACLGLHYYLIIYYSEFLSDCLYLFTTHLYT